MKQKGIIFLCFILLVSADVFAQKVKYKDLFVLLSANDFKQAEPFLRRFMVQDPEHPNANMYMAKMFEYKYGQHDVLKETDLYTSYCDSAVYYYRQTYGLIDEKEIKKNDEYYQDYSRRDLRTGNFGVKVTDVKFDLEKKIDDIEKLSNNVRSSKENFDNAVNSYLSAETTYSNLTSRFSSLPALLLTSEDSDLDSLKNISQSFDVFSKDFKSYQQSISTVPGAGYRQKLVTKFVEGLTKPETPDFFGAEIEVYDYKSWSDAMSGAIVNDIRPMKENMSTYDQQLDDLYKQVTVDSMTVENELASLTEKMFFEQLKNYDTDPLPSLVFNFKVDEITYHSYRNHAYENGYLDSTNIDFQINLYEDLFEKYKWVEDAYNKLSKINAAEKAELYSDFVNKRFGDVSGLTEYISRKGEEVSVGKTEFVNKIDELIEMSRWGIYESDSIPLFPVDSTGANSGLTNNYNTLAVDTLETGYVALGIMNKKGSVRNFAAKIGFDRQVEELYLKPLNFKFDTTSITEVVGWSQSYSKSDIEGDYGYIYIFKVHSNPDSYNSNYQITNLILDTGLKWSSTFNNPFSLIELSIDTNTSLIVLKMGEISEDGQRKEVENLVFNFDGKLLLTGGN